MELYMITIENAIGEQRLIDEIFSSRERARNRVEGSDSRWCYYYIYEIWFEKDQLKHKLVDKIWNNT